MEEAAIAGSSRDGYLDLEGKVAVYLSDAADGSQDTVSHILRESTFVKRFQRPFLSHE